MRDAKEKVNGEVFRFVHYPFTMQTLAQLEYSQNISQDKLNQLNHTQRLQRKFKLQAVPVIFAL